MKKPITPKDLATRFQKVDDLKVRQSLIMMTDRFDDNARKFIQMCYQSDKLARIWQETRNSGVYEKGSAGEAGHRTIVEFPNAYVFDFVDEVLKGQYGVDWLYNNRALKHELVRQWWVVNKIDRTVF